MIINDFGLLGPSWEASWRPLGASWRHLGGHLRRLRMILRLTPHRRPLGGLSGGGWVVFRRFCAVWEAVRWRLLHFIRQCVWVVSWGVDFRPCCGMGARCGFCHLLAFCPSRDRVCVVGLNRCGCREGCRAKLLGGRCWPSGHAATVRAFVAQSSLEC